MRLVVAATAVVATLVAGVDTAAACSCVAEPPRVKLAAADGAFNGRLLDVTPSGEFEAVYRYRIGQVFKGRKRLHRGKVVKVRSGSNDGVCGLPQGTGKVYGLFVSREDGHWAGNSCNVVSPGQLRRAARKASSSTSSADDAPWATVCG
jgi:hypothetical protein